MSDTPRTDAIALIIAAGDWNKEQDCTQCALDHARQLERELAAKERDISQLCTRRAEPLGEVDKLKASLTTPKVMNCPNCKYPMDEVSTGGFVCLNLDCADCNKKCTQQRAWNKWHSGNAKDKPDCAPRTCSATRVDCNEIVRRLTERNPQFKESILDGKISLEDFAEIVVVQWKAFNRIP